MKGKTKEKKSKRKSDQIKLQIVKSGLCEILC